MRIQQKICAVLAALLLCGQGAVATAAAGPDSAPATTETAQQASADVPVYTETLQDRHIRGGQTLSYTTVSSQFADMPPMEGIYPGALTITIAGTVVVEAGGCLNIGTLSVGGGEESPVLSWAPDARIVVEAGGCLKLTGVQFAGVQETPVIYQETGGSVLLQATPVEEGWVAWSAPVVNNLDRAPDDLWLEVGTALTAELLPAAWSAEVEAQGTTQWTELALAWDLTGCAGQTEGQATVPGQFLDETGAVLSSLRPLELTVHWYTPQELVVTDAVWKGDTVPSAQLTVPWLPEEATVWGEVSTDDGESWTRWDDPETFFIVPVEGGGYACVFALPDATPRLFRLAARSPEDPCGWRSEAFALSPNGTGDSEGNHGGSILPDTPERDPTLPAPTPTVTPTPTPAMQADPSPTPATQEAPTPTPEPTPTASAQAGANPQPAATPQPTAGPQTGAVPAATPQPAVKPETTPGPAPAQRETAIPAQGRTPVSSATVPQSTPAPTLAPAASPTASPAVSRAATPETAAPAETPSPAGTQPAAKPSLPVQLLAVVAGLAVCGALAVAVTRTGPLGRKR